MDTNSNTSDMGPHKQLNSPKFSDIECSSSESIIAISTAILNPPPEFPEGVESGKTLPPESHVKSGKMTNISSKRKLEPSKDKEKKTIFQTFQLSPKVNEGESGALSPYANGNNNGHQINITNSYPAEIADIGGLTNHDKNIVQSPNFHTQGVTTITNENISTETQTTVAEDEIVLTHQWILLFVH
ncbi:hypothetical protein O181_090494 [Austropuccinia psidii MF-1]|uniref:Uncharacterized protein n=1 Tax=Austropuccinia psidii MF-1 TaxID=1389203 RepID=A0A9Q3IVQ6_9BASI|nr:hypothetical protein [Austropuccinia psidii MF-1]